MDIVHRQTCRVCGSPHLTDAIDLGEQYLQGSFVKEGHAMPTLQKFPTLLVRCDLAKNEKSCGLLQLKNSVPAEILYANYWYRSGTNATMRTHLAGIVKSSIGVLGRNPGRVLDIGCNDGTLLGNYSGDVERFGCDPSDIARVIKPPVTLVNTVFPSPQLTAAVGGKKFDIVTSIAMYYDLESPTAFARAVRELLAPEGIWILEMSYLPLMLKQNSFDTICHEHLEYYSLGVLEYIAREARLRIFKAELNDVNGGSLRLYLTQGDNSKYDTAEDEHFLRHLRAHEQSLKLDTAEPYLSFQRRIEEVRKTLMALLADVRRKGEHVHLYGASTKGNVLLQWYGIDSSIVDCAADRNPEKHGARTLGTNIPIVSEEESRTAKPDYYLVLPWHFKAEFLERERAQIMAGTKMIFPLPEVVVVGRGNIDAEIEKSCRADFIAI